MEVRSTHLTLCNESTSQESLGELHKYSEQLTENFLYSLEKRKLLAQLSDGKTLYVLNWVWPNITPHLALPENYDTYVFLQYREPVDWAWFDQFARLHATQKIILLTQLPSSDTPYKNFQVVEHQWHTHYVSRSLVTYGQAYNFKWPRRYLVSSLANKPSFFKTLTTAYFHKNYINRDDLVLSWNINKKNEICGSMRCLDGPHGRDQLDQMCSYYRSTLKYYSISQEPWINEHYQNNDWTTSRAYTDTTINFTNETYAQGQAHQRIFPGPQLTEKTRKALVAGCAIVPVGMPGVYDQLKRFGLKFDYPWSCEFDKMLGDLDRVEQVFTIIDEIMSYDLDWLQQQLKDSVEYNYYYLRDIAYIDHMDKINLQAISKYLYD